MSAIKPEAWSQCGGGDVCADIGACDFCKPRADICFYCGSLLDKSVPLVAWCGHEAPGNWIALHRECALTLGTHLIMDSRSADLFERQGDDKRVERQFGTILGLRRTLADIQRWTADPRVREAATEALERHVPDWPPARAVSRDT